MVLSIYLFSSMPYSISIFISSKLFSINIRPSFSFSKDLVSYKSDFAKFSSLLFSRIISYISSPSCKIVTGSVYYSNSPKVVTSVFVWASATKYSACTPTSAILFFLLKKLLFNYK